MSIPCDGFSSQYPNPCTRKPRWLVDFGLPEPSVFCNYHKENAEFVSKMMAGPLKITRLEPCPAPESTPAT